MPVPSAQTLSKPEPYRSAVAQLVAVMFVLSAMAIGLWRRSESVAPSRDTVSAVQVTRAVPAATAPIAQPAPAVLAAPKLDRVAVAQAEAELAAARREWLRAEERAEQAAAALESVASQSAAAALAARTIAARIRDPSVRIARDSDRLVQLRAERDRVQTELAGLARVDRPKPKSLIDRTPVAKPAEGDEYHFEIRRNRVTFIDLERLLERVRADARLRVRMNDDRRPIASSVGPVGAFSLRYELERALPTSVEDVLELRGPTYLLRSWQVVPEFEGRGESFDMAFRPASDFARTLNRLNPARATITMWVYPDGFALYRKLRDALHARGFLVAARPLPEGMAIRGSPAGSLSAGQ